MNNLEIKALYGEKKKNKSNNSKAEIKELKDDEKGIKSEIFWTLEHEADETKLKKKKPSKKNADLKKIKSNEERTPEAFARFKYDLPKPVKVTIKDVMDDLNSQMNLRSSVENNVDQKEIPFNSKQLKELISFPLTLETNNLIVESFSDSTLSPSTFIPTPSVSKILQATMSTSQRNALIQWKSLKIAELGLEGFEEMQKLHLNRGKQFHEYVQKYFDGVDITDVEIPEEITNIWHSVLPILGEFETPGLFTEQFISHPYLHYKGVVDCVSLHNDSVTVIEWKNSERQKKTISSTFDAPLQLCAYVAALNASDFKFKEPIKSGAIVIAYNDGQPADLFTLNEKELNRYWKLWLNRLQEYWTRYRDNTLTDEVI